MLDQKYQITMVRGDTLSFSLDFDGLDQTVTAAFFSCKNEATDPSYVFQKTLEDGITKIGDHLYKVRVAPEDTANLEAKTYAFDMEICIGNDVFTIMIGELEIVQDVTWGGSN